MNRIAIRILNGFLLVLLGCSVVWSQGSTAQISGSVTDPSGAVLPGVEITATQTDTGVSRTAISNETGVYVLPNLPIGPYRLEATLPGFRTFAQTGIVLQVNSNPAINIVLQVGQLTETVEVQANAAMVETRSTGVGQVMENARILELPLVGRQVYDLVILSGAAVQTGIAQTTNRAAYPGTPTFSIAGSLNTGNTVTLDGAMHNDVASNTALPLPFPDAIQEFKVETSSLPAQYGFHSGAALNAVTKSGTNEFHGTLFEFIRNYKFNGRNFFSPTKDFLKRNQFGGSVGGPIKKNKLFFFGGYQGTTTRQDPVRQIVQVPTPAMLTGDFTAYASAACRTTGATTLPDPFVGNKIDPSRLSKAAVNLVKRLPTPQDQCGFVEFGNPVKSNEHQLVGKMDYNWSTTHQIFGRYLGAFFDQPAAYTLSQNLLSTPARGSSLKVNSFVVGDTYLAGTNTVNSFRATWNRTTDLKKPASFFGASDLGINIWNDPPDYMTLAVTGGFSIGGAGSSYLHWAWTTMQLSDDLSLVRGNHQLSFGVSLLGFQSNSHHSTFSGGIFTINNLSDFMIGRVQSLVQGLPYTLWVTNKYMGTYAQDSWKVAPSLTLNYGVRWEPFIPQQFDRLRQANTFDFDAYRQGIKTSQYVNAPPGIFYPGDPQFGDNGTSPINKRWNQIAPRVGLVWDPKKDGKMVIRAGYGIFYDMQSAELNLATPQGPPWGGKVQLTNPQGGLDDPYRFESGGNPFPFVVSRNSPYPAAGVFTTFDHNTHPPYVQQWNLGIQRQVGQDWLVSASYIGNEIVHLYGSTELNPAIYFSGSANASGQCFAEGYVLNTTPGAVCSSTANTNSRRVATLINPVEGPKFANIGKWDDGGTRSYNALLLSTQKRLSRGLSMTGNYTWSHCIGTAIGSGTLLQSSAGNGVYLTPTRAGDRGNCTTPAADIRHIVNATGIVNVPKFSNPWMNAVASNWRVSGILNVSSGSAFTVVSGTDRALNGKNAPTQYANQVAENVYGNQCENDLRQASGAKCLWLNTAAFLPADTGTFGNLRPGTVFGPGNWALNAGLSRIFKITEGQTMEFRAEGTNVLNHTNFMNPSGTYTSSTFGRIQSARDGRVMQFGLKYLF
jgi:Carboxypeptidase regulatory-like domain